MPNVLVPLAHGCEELEAVTLVDVLRRGGIEVVAAGLEDGPVKGSRGVVLVPDTTLDKALEAGDFDMVALPGGMGGTHALANDPRVEKLLHHLAAEGKWVAAICAAPMVLAKAGLLDGKKFTVYPGVLEDGDTRGGRCTGAAVEVDGRVATSRGPGTAMDFALCLLELLAGRETRNKVEEGLVR